MTGSSCIPQLKYCCCGCTLRTGVLIIGWITVFSNVPRRTLRASDSINTTGPTEEYAYGTFNIFHLIAAIMLLVGAWKKIASCLKPYLILGVFSTIFLSIFLLVNFFTDFEYQWAVEELEKLANGKDISDEAMLDFKRAIREKLSMQSIVYTLSIPLSIYFLLVVKSYYCELKQAESAAPAMSAVIISQVRAPNGNAPHLYPTVPGIYPNVPVLYAGAPPQYPGAPLQYPGAPAPYMAAPPPYPGEVKNNGDGDIKKVKPEDIA